MSESISLTILSDLANLPAGFHDEWSHLHALTPFATPFQSPAWLQTWWRHFGSGELFMFLFRDSNRRLVGVFPCFLHEWLGRRQLTLVGSGLSDYLEPLIEEQYRTAVVQALAGYLRSTDTWDLCSWQDLAVGSALAGIASDNFLSVQQEPDQSCSRIALSGDFELYWADRPSGLRRNVRRYSQKAAELAPIHFECCCSYETSYMEALIRLHSARWQEQGQAGMIAANRSGQFLRDACRLFANQQKLLFFGLQFQGEIVAVILALSHRNELFAYLSAFDPVYAALGFGRILLFEALRHASSAGYSSWNFLRGDEPYKIDWGAEPVAKSRVTVTRIRE